jgi:YidC/Oxa1 family membrane protein insertase
MGFIGEFFNLILINPLTNLFVVLTALTGNAGLAVIALTIIIRLVTLPLTLKQMHSTRMMALLAPRVQEIQKRYKDPRRRSEEQMRLYRESGINPLGCLSGMLLQFPILIALYQTFIVALGSTPEALIKVSNRLYNWDYLREAFPLPGNFLWLHLGEPDPYPILPILVGLTTYVLQKMTMMPATDERTRAQNSMMNMLMPFIFAYITFTLPSGLGLYYVLSNIIGVVMQYAYVGGGPINWRGLVGLSQDAVLPRAVEVREAQAASVRRLGGDVEPEPEPAQGRRSRANRQAAGNGDGANANATRRRRVGRQSNAARRRGRRPS